MQQTIGFPTLMTQLETGVAKGSILSWFCFVFSVCKGRLKQPPLHYFSFLISEACSIFHAHAHVHANKSVKLKLKFRITFVYLNGECTWKEI